MLHQLLESGARAPQRGKWALMSGVAHAALVTAATILTMQVRPAPGIDREQPPEIIYRAPFMEPVPSTPPAPPIAPPNTPILPRETQVQFPTIPPVGIPAPSARLSDPVADIPGTGLIGPLGPARPVTGEIATASTVDRAVVPRRDNPTPEFPGALRSAGVEGSVLVQFVVDTTGRVEASSITILRATHAQFGEAVRRWLGRTRYSPAMVGSERVRQLVQQEVGFTLTP